ncbi:MAG: M28 family peptidase [Candidatus Sumerlaeia bacterium]|nr:M28 family peptidase [Candidatus Sumerlaeia bacterium]
MLRRLETAAATLLALAPLAATAAEDALRSHVEILASEKMAGRMTGTEGERLAAEYLAEQLAAIGAKPLPGEDDFFLPFEFSAGAQDAGSTITVSTPHGERTWTFGDGGVVALSFSDSATVTAPVVFAGYGIKTPESSSTPYDSFFGLDLKDKIVLVLHYFPENAEGDFRNELSQYFPLRFKALHARGAGAKGMLVAIGPNSPRAGELIALTSDTAMSGSGIAAASISGEMADYLFEHGADKSLAEAQSALDSGNPHVGGFDLKDTTVTLATSLERSVRTGTNVVAHLPATTDSAEWLVVGAHYDHLGTGGGGNSLAREGEQAAIHYGADDNASGTAVVLEMARALAADRERARHTAIAFWSGEELGLLGSRAFLRSGTLDKAAIVANLNFDMVGRSKDGKLSLQGVGSSPVWRSIAERANLVPGLDLTLSDDPYLPTDAAAFYDEKIPIMAFFTGVHEDYHRPSDTPEKLDYAAMADIATLGTRTARLLLAEPRPEYVSVERERQPMMGRTVRAYTGTIPDYTTEVKGLLLSGVVEGGPAAKAGLKGGDVITRLGGTDITNIYDYTYALGAVKVGEPVEVVVERDGETLELELTPEAR